MLSLPRYRQIWKTAFLPVVDFISIFGGLWLVYLIRYRWFEGNFTSSGTSQFPIISYFWITILISAIITFVYALLGLYQITNRKSFWKIVTSLFFGIFLVLFALITYFFFYEYNREVLPNGVPVSRFILASAGFVALYLVLLGRSTIWAIEQILYYFKITKINVAIIGHQDAHFSEKFQKQNHINQVFNYLELNEKTFQKLKNLIENWKIQEIYLLKPYPEFSQKLALLAERHKISYLFIPSTEAFDLKPVYIFDKVFLEILHTNLDGWQVVLKRVFDILFALTFLIVFSWLYLLIAIFIKIDSKGSIFYLSERVGPNGKVFKVWKFRRLEEEFCTTEDNTKSLELEAELIAKKNIRKDNVLYKIPDDPRSTKVGKFLEKTSLDELPQFINVLFGDMSLVGPRPHQPREVAKYQSHHYKVLNIQPGLTGLAQINGRSDLTFEDEVKYDIYYVENWNFWMDVWIILKTPFVLIFRKHN